MSAIISLLCCCDAAPPVLEACCLSDGSSIMATLMDCAAAAGTPQGPGSDCVNVECEPDPGGPCDNCNETITASYAWMNESGANCNGPPLVETGTCPVLTRGAGSCSWNGHGSCFRSIDGELQRPAV